MQFHTVIIFLATYSLVSALRHATRSSSTDFTPIMPCVPNDPVLDGAGICGSVCYEAEITCTADGKYVVCPMVLTLRFFNLNPFHFKS